MKLQSHHQLFDMIKSKQFSMSILLLLMGLIQADANITIPICDSLPADVAVDDMAMFFPSYGVPLRAAIFCSAMGAKDITIHTQNQSDLLSQAYAAANITQG
jgi:hypothetical protein